MANVIGTSTIGYSIWSYSNSKYMDWGQFKHLVINFAILQIISLDAKWLTKDFRVHISINNKSGVFDFGLLSMKIKLNSKLYWTNLWFCTLLFIACWTFFFIATLFTVNSLTFLEWLLVTIIVVECSAFLPWDYLTVVLGDLPVGCLGALMALLTLLPLHIPVLLNINLLAVLLGKISALLSGNFVTLLSVICQTFLLWDFDTVLDILAMLFRNIFTTCAVSCLTLFSGNWCTLLFIRSGTVFFWNIL